MQTLGINLSETDKKHVLSAFVHRFTISHVPQWVSGNYVKYPHFTDDCDWLRNTYFETKKDGTLDRRFHSCRSNPTWPFGKGINQRSG